MVSYMAERDVLETAHNKVQRERIPDVTGHIYLDEAAKQLNTSTRRVQEKAGEMFGKKLPRFPGKDKKGRACKRTYLPLNLYEKLSHYFAHGKKVTWPPPSTEVESRKPDVEASTTAELRAQIEKGFGQRDAARSTESTTVLTGRASIPDTGQRFSPVAREVTDAVLSAVEQPATEQDTKTIARRGRKRDPQTQAVYEFCYYRWTDDGPSKTGHRIQHAANSHFGRKVISDPRFSRQFAERFARANGKQFPCPEPERISLE
jgi:hypothetical protein